MWVVKRVILLFHSFCSNVAKQVAWFCYTFYRRFGAPWVNKLQFTKNLQYFLLLTLYREQNKLHIFVEPQKSNGFRQKLIRTRWNVSVRARSNWKLKVLVFKERGKPEYPEKNLWEQGREPTTNSTHICRRRQDLNPDHILRWEASCSLILTANNHITLIIRTSHTCILTCPASRQIYSNKRKEFNSQGLVWNINNGRRFVVLDDQYGRQICMCMTLFLYTDFSPLSLTPERIKKTKVLKYSLALSTKWRITRGNNGPLFAWWRHCTTITTRLFAVHI